MFKRVASVVLALMMIASISACTTTKPATAGLKTHTTVTFWNGWTGPDGVLLKKLVKQYNDKNKDNVTVNMDIMEFASLQEKLATSIASNTNPNLHLGFAVGEYTLEGIYLPIDTIFEKTSLQKSDFTDGILKQCYYNGKLMGLPFQISASYLFWNKDLFTKAGLDPNTPPKTWDELITMSNKMNNLGSNIMGGGFGCADWSVTAQNMVTNGGGILKENDDKSFTSLILDPSTIAGNKAALEYMKKYGAQNKKNLINTTDLETTFMAGNAGMLINGAWETAGCKTNKLNYGVSLTPAGPGGIIESAGPICICIMKNTTGDKLQAAYDFINYWNNNTNNPVTGKTVDSPALQWTKNQGYQPYLTSVATDKTLLNDKDYKVTVTYAQHIHLAFPSDFWNSYSLTQTATIPMTESVVYGKATIDQALAACDVLVKKSIAYVKQVQDNAKNSSK